MKRTRRKELLVLFSIACVVALLMLPGLARSQNVKPGQARATGQQHDGNAQLKMKTLLGRFTRDQNVESGGSHTLFAVSSPANDDCANEFDLTDEDLPFMEATDTTPASQDGPESSCQCCSEKDIWYGFTNTTAEPLTVDVTTALPGTDIFLAAVLVLYRVDGSDPCNFSTNTEIDCDEAQGGASLSFTAEPGVLYKIQVTGHDDDGPVEIGISSPQLSRVTTQFAGAFLPFETNNAKGTSQSARQGTATQGLVVTDSGRNQVRVFMSHGDGTFLPGESFTVGQGPGGLAPGDFNNDGHTDVAVTNRLSDNLSILLGNGDGTFVAQPFIPVGTEPTAVAAGDFNQDGTPDLAVANFADDNVMILSGRGDGTFDPNRRVYSVGTGPTGIAMGDLDQDGRLDLAVCNIGSNDVTLLWGQDGGGFARSGAVSVGQKPMAISAADFDGDGWLELVTANFGSNDVSILRTNDGDNFRLVKSRSTGDGPVALATGAFLNPYQGLAVANQTSGDISVRPGDESGALTQLQTYHAGASPASIITGDFNNDSRLDLAVLTATGGLIRVLLDGGDGRFHLAR